MDPGVAAAVVAVVGAGVAPAGRSPRIAAGSRPGALAAGLGAAATAPLAGAVAGGGSTPTAGGFAVGSTAPRGGGGLPLGRAGFLPYSGLKNLQSVTFAHRRDVNT